MTKNGAIITAAILGAAITGVFMIAAAFIQAPRKDVATPTPVLPKQTLPQQQAPAPPAKTTVDPDRPKAPSLPAPAPVHVLNEAPEPAVAARRLIRVANATGQTISDGQTVTFKRERSRQFVTDGDLVVTLDGYPSGTTVEVRWLLDGNEVQYKKGPTDGTLFVNELKDVVLDLSTRHAFMVLVGINESPAFARSFSVFDAALEGQ